jgi:dipeptidyl aminopeptidase/acylaminoacyl peptidase
MKPDAVTEDAASGLRPPSRQSGAGGRRRRLGVWLFLGAMFLVGVRWLYGWAGYPHPAEQLARELGALSVIQKPPVVSADGTKLGIIHTTERGVGVFIAAVGEPKEQLLLEIKDADYDVGSAYVFGWSPGGESFAFAMTNCLHFWRRGNVGRYAFERGLQMYGIRHFSWLSEDRGLYLNNGGILRVLKPEGLEWVEVQAWQLPKTLGEVRTVWPLGNAGLALHADQGMLWLELASGTVQEVHRAGEARIVNVDYDPTAEVFLLTQTHALPNRQTRAELVKLPFSAEGKTGEATVLAEGASILEGRWLNGGNGFAYRTVRAGRSQLLVKTGAAERERSVFARGEVYQFNSARGGTALFAQASLTNEPPGIWRYEVNQAQTESAWSPLGPEGMSGELQPVLKGSAPYGGRHHAAFDLVPPANFSRHKKYPLVIGLGGYEWTPIAHGISAQALARGGAYVALVNYRWNQSRAETVFGHTNNVLAVYDLMMAHPNVDPERVFLFAFSAGTLVEQALVEMYPRRWRGVMFFNPSVLPKPDLKLQTRLLAAAGEAESGAAERFVQIQEELCRVGVPTRWHIHPDGRHIIRAKQGLRDRALWSVDFVFEK